MDVLPKLDPVELWGLSFAQARNAAKAGMAIRRAHWCSPVLIWEDGKLMQDDDGDLSPFVAMPEDRSARDWNCQLRETPNPSHPSPKGTNP